MTKEDDKSNQEDNLNDDVEKNKPRFCSRRRLFAMLLLSLSSQYVWLYRAKPIHTTSSNRFNNSNTKLHHKNNVLSVGSNTTLIQRHRRPNNRILFLLHIHKSGGSTMCALAAKNRFKVNSKRNCNVQDDQRCCGSADSLEAQARFARITPYDFVANEQDMYKAMDPTHYHYIVVLRNSADRYLSHWKHVCRESNQTTTESVFVFDTWWQAQPDNWNVRKLCGTQCQNVTKFQITRELFEYTFDRLRLFDNVLLLEYWNKMFPAFARAVGWSRMSALQKKQVAKKNAVYPALGETAWDPFMSVLDDALYEWVLARFRGNEVDYYWTDDMKERMELYFTMGQQRNCENPCCAESCSAYR